MSMLNQLLHHQTLVVDSSCRELTEFVRSVPRRFALGEGQVLYKGRNELRVFVHQGREFVVKSYRRPIFINRLVYGFLRPSKARRAFEHARMLLAAGVGTPAPVGYINVRQGLLFDHSYLVTAKSACPHVYADLFVREFACAEQVLRAIGRVTAVLHDKGYALKDYGRGNILFAETEQGILLEMVDVNRMSVGAPLSLHDGCRNFERLPATPQMHRWMAEEYARARGFDVDECLRLMVQFRSTQDGKIDGKY